MKYWINELWMKDHTMLYFSVNPRCWGLRATLHWWKSQTGRWMFEMDFQIGPIEFGAAW